jgi:glutamine amidotransferase
MIAIINYGLGNLTSILNMCKRLGIDAVITCDHDEIKRADKLILPGVGHFKKGIENLKETGLQPLLNELVLHQKKPILGICLGAQLMTMHSEEGNADGLKWINAKTVRFNTSAYASLKVPHMGWCDIELKDCNVLWNDLPSAARFYHVHTFHFEFEDSTEVIAISNYGYEFVCAFNYENIFGVQFHPEKSHKFGMKVLQNFAKIK